MSVRQRLRRWVDVEAAIKTVPNANLAAVEAFADGAAYARLELRERADKMIKDRPYIELADIFDDLFGEVTML